MPQIARLGDSSDHGGVIITASATYIADGARGALEGDLHSCPTHGVTALTSGSIVICLGRRIVRIGDTAECGAAIITGDVHTDSD